MNCSLFIDNKSYTYNTKCFYDLSIPINFNGHQVNFFDVSKATAAPYKSGAIIGSTKKGGGCNFDVLSLIPHCNGTHTECVGHIVDDDININTILEDNLFPATLISVHSEDDLIHSDQIKLDNVNFNSGLIIRTLPNDNTKTSMIYDKKNIPPYFSENAMYKIKELGVTHLLVDMPTIDLAYDNGKLINHHIFWNINQGSHKISGSVSNKTITEMIFVPNQIKDGNYLLQLQVVNFTGDAAPSKPIIYPLEIT